MKIYLILLLIILVCSINYNYYENYYTFFKPFEIKTKMLDTGKYIQNLYIFSSYIENKNFLIELIKILLSNTRLVNLKITFPYTNKIHIIDPILSLLNNNKIQFSILPIPLVYLKNEEYKNIRSLINISDTSFYMIYNSSRYGKEILNLKDFKINNKDVIFGTTGKHSISYKITKNFLENINKHIPHYRIKTDSFKNLIDNLMDDNNDLSIVTFLDSNPSKKLQNIINNDFEKKIYVQELSLDLFDLNKKTDYIYNEIYVKYIEPSFLYPNNKYKTLSFNNLLLTNKYVSDIIVSIILKGILKHKKFINNQLKGYTITDMNAISSIHTLIPHSETHNVLNNLALLDSIENNR
jgi:hypothetical protein